MVGLKGGRGRGSQRQQRYHTLTLPTAMRLGIENADKTPVWHRKKMIGDRQTDTAHRVTGKIRSTDTTQHNQGDTNKDTNTAQRTLHHTAHTGTQNHFSVSPRTGPFVRRQSFPREDKGPDEGRLTHTRRLSRNLRLIGKRLLQPTQLCVLRLVSSPVRRVEVVVVVVVVVVARPLHTLLVLVPRRLTRTAPKHLKVRRIGTLVGYTQTHAHRRKRGQG